MPCKQYGSCCKNLHIQDMVSISLATWSFMFKEKCRFQLENNKLVFITGDLNFVENGKVVMLLIRR